MTIRSKSPCRHVGCRVLVDVAGYCEAHAKKVEAQRGTASQRGYGHKWRKARITFLARSPLCAECQRQGVTRPAAEVDHIIAHKGSQDLFWDTSNWQALCKPCHSEKTVREDGGWGRQAG